MIRFGVFRNAHDNIGVTKEMPWVDLASRLIDHKPGIKDGVAITCATFSGKRGNDTLIARYLIGLDVEADKRTGEIPPSPVDIASVIRGKRLASAIYTTFSSTPESPRYRVIFPLSKPFELAGQLELDPYLGPTVSAQIGLSGVCDRSKFGASSLFYLPRHPPGSTTHYATTIPGDPIDTDELMAIAQMVSEKVATDEARIAEMRARNALPPEVLEIIDDFNSRHPLPEMLAKYGYTRRGNRWRSPNQHVEGATVILNDGRTFVSFSASDADAGVGARPLKASSQAMCWGSAFDLHKDFECRGNFREALRRAREELGR